MTFEPWIGKYYNTGICGKKVLVVGESYYKDEEWTNTPALYKDATTIAISKFVRGWNQTTFDAFTRIMDYPFTNESPSCETKERIWNSVMFYNFIQDGFREYSSDSSQIPNEWLVSGKQHLVDVLSYYDPDVTIIFSRQIWKHYAPYNGHDYSIDYQQIKLNHSSVSAFWLNDNNDKRQHLILGIHHPSTLWSFESRQEVHHFIFSTIMGAYSNQKYEV